MVLLFHSKTDPFAASYISTQAFSTSPTIILIDDATMFSQAVDEYEKTRTDIAVLVSRLNDEVIDIALQEDLPRLFLKFICGNTTAGYRTMGKSIAHILRKCIHPT